MNVYPVVRLGQTTQPISQPLQTSAPSSFLTNPKAAIDAQIATVENTVAEKLKDQNFKSMLIGGGVGLVIGLILFPIGQSLMGYSAIKKSDLPPQDFAY
jgi:hypothetical protein